MIFLTIKDQLPGRDHGLTEIPTLQALSVHLRQQTLDNAGRNITRLNSAIERAKSTDAQRLKDEYQRLVRGLQTQGNLPSADPRPAGAGGEDWLANPALPEDIMREAVSNCTQAGQGGGGTSGVGRRAQNELLDIPQA